MGNTAIYNRNLVPKTKNGSHFQEKITQIYGDDDIKLLEKHINENTLPAIREENADNAELFIKGQLLLQENNSDKDILFNKISEIRDANKNADTQLKQKTTVPKTTEENKSNIYPCAPETLTLETNRSREIKLETQESPEIKHITNNNLHHENLNDEPITPSDWEELHSCPLYPEATISVLEAILLFNQYIINSNTNKTHTGLLIKLINNLLPNGHHFPASYYKFIKVCIAILFNGANADLPFIVF